MAVLLAANPELPARPIWLTPLLQHNLLVETGMNWRGPSLWIASRADRTFNLEAFERVRQVPEAQVLLLEDGDHRLEINGSLEGSLLVLNQVLGQIRRFVLSVSRANLDNLKDS